MLRVKIEKLVFGGQALGRVDDKAVFVWNALPGEEVEVELKKNKHNFAEGVVKEIITRSPDRLEPRENHFLSCSPWQIMSFATENKWKVEMSIETYQKFAGLTVTDLEIVSDGVEYGYRNKMEYSFTEENSVISLAFFERNGKKHLAIPKCELASEAINKVALELLAWVNENKISLRSLKTMIIRSNQKGEVLAGLFIKDRLEFNDYPKLTNNLVGLTIYYSTHKSPASVPTAVLYKIGQDYLEEDLFGVKLRYGLFSFFQINVPIFKQALAEIKNHLSNNDKVVDYYSGVGAIGLPVGAKELVESNPEAVEFAKINIELNKIKAEAICAPSEKMVELITAEKTIIFDPPRAGLDKRVVDQKINKLPKKIIYLSCDIATQARDLGLLKEAYEIKFLKLYNFFPRTAHIEGLCVLEKK